MVLCQSEFKIDRPSPGLPRVSPRPHTEALGTRLPLPQMRYLTLGPRKLKSRYSLNTVGIFSCEIAHSLSVLLLIIKFAEKRRGIWYKHASNPSVFRILPFISVRLSFSLTTSREIESFLYDCRITPETTKALGWISASFIVHGKSQHYEKFVAYLKIKWCFLVRRLSSWKFKTRDLFASISRSYSYIIHKIWSYLQEFTRGTFSRILNLWPSTSILTRGLKSRND